MNMFDLSNKVTIVTGGNRGIGLAIARGFASAGATAVIANRRTAEGQKAAEALRRDGLAEIVKSIPRGRPGAPQDCVSAALFLASDASDFVTGHVLFADGGTTIC